MQGESDYNTILYTDEKMKVEREGGRAGERERERERERGGGNPQSHTYTYLAFSCQNNLHCEYIYMS